MNLSFLILKIFYEYYDINNLVEITLKIEDANIRTYSHKRNKLQNIHTIGRETMNIFINIWEIKIKINPEDLKSRLLYTHRSDIEACT